MNTINVNINFGTKTTNITNIVPLTVGDYNSTKIVFEFDISEGTKVFEMSNSKGELVFLSEIIDNEVVLGGKNESDEPASIFATPGKYAFEVSLYTTDGKLSSGVGYLAIEDEGVKIEQNIVDSYFPLIHQMENLVPKDEIPETEWPIFDNCYRLFSGGARLNMLEKTLRLCKNVTNMNLMFEECTAESLDLSNFDTSKVTHMNSTFLRYDKLKYLNLDNWDVSELTTTVNMFAGCRNLESVDLSSWKTNKITSMYGMFGQCYHIKSIDLSNLDTSQCTNMNDMFTYDDELTDLKIKFNSNSNIEYCPLTKESISWILRNINPVSTTKTLRLGQPNYLKATQEDLDAAIAKGWKIE